MPEAHITNHDSDERAPALEGMTSDSAIRVRNLSKRFKMYGYPAERLKELLHPFRKKYHREFWALRDIDVEIPRGTTFGIIGQNGSGKSTLLQLISGILQPTSGSVQVNGRISALLELGAGFNPHFTGRENVYMNGAVRGLPKEVIDARFEEIADFADIGNFIDQPVKTYSSGMYVRLAFATAINIDPDILIVDEALAVGDSMFQRRCYRKIEDFKEKGKTIVFVSHSLETIVNICSDAMLLDSGKIVQRGKAKDVVHTYSKMLVEREEEYFRRMRSERKTEAGPAKSESLQPQGGLKAEKLSEFRYGTGEAEIIDFRMLDGEGRETALLESGQKYTIRSTAFFKRDVSVPVMGMMIRTLTGIEIGGNNTGYDTPIHPVKAGDKVAVDFEQEVMLNPGTYTLTVNVSELAGTRWRDLDRRNDVIVFKVIGNQGSTGLVQMKTRIEINYNEGTPGNVS